MEEGLKIESRRRERGQIFILDIAGWRKASMRFLWNQTESKVKDKDLIPIFGTHGTLMKIITLHLLVIVGEGRNADPRGVCGSAAVKVIQKMQSGDRDS